MTATATLENPSLDKATSLISALGLDDSFQPQEPATTKDTGLSESLIEDLILKFLSGVGSESGRAISDNVCLPMAILEDRLTTLRQRQEIAPSGSAMLGDHIYRLTDVGRDRALRALRECAYVGPAPVLLDDYVSSVQAQTIASERPRRPQLERAFSDIHIEPQMFDQLGPAINAGKGMFIYGPPGNGKTTIAKRITRCFGQNILVPHAIVEGGRIIKMYDASCHKAVRTATESLFRTAEFDRRWIRIERPTVIVGGGVSRAGGRLLEPLQGRIAALVPVAPRVVLSTLGDEAVALGAARLALQTVEERLEFTDHHTDRHVRVTVSVAVVTVAVAAGTVLDPDRLMAEALAGLERAKRAGRNRVDSSRSS